MSIEIKGIVLVNDAKYRRCFNSELGAGADATEEQVLALYDKFGGLMKKGAKIIKATKKGEQDKVSGGEVVPNGKFWNYELRKPVKEEKKKEDKKKEEVEEKKEVVKETKKK